MSEFTQKAIFDIDSLINTKPTGALARVSPVALEEAVNAYQENISNGGRPDAALPTVAQFAAHLYTYGESVLTEKLRAEAEVAVESQGPLTPLSNLVKNYMNDQVLPKDKKASSLVRFRVSSHHKNNEVTYANGDVKIISEALLRYRMEFPTPIEDTTTNKNHDYVVQVDVADIVVDWNTIDTEEKAAELRDRLVEQYLSALWGFVEGFTDYLYFGLFNRLLNVNIEDGELVEPKFVIQVVPNLFRKDRGFNLLINQGENLVRGRVAEGREDALRLQVDSALKPWFESYYNHIVLGAGDPEEEVDPTSWIYLSHVLKDYSALQDLLTTPTAFIENWRTLKTPRRVSYDFLNSVINRVAQNPVGMLRSVFQAKAETVDPENVQRNVRWHKIEDGVFSGYLGKVKVFETEIGDLEDKDATEGDDQEN